MNRSTIVLSVVLLIQTVAVPVAGPVVVKTFKSEISTVGRLVRVGEAEYGDFGYDIAESILTDGSVSHSNPGLLLSVDGAWN